MADIALILALYCLLRSVRNRPSQPPQVTVHVHCHFYGDTDPGDPEVEYEVEGERNVVVLRPRNVA